MLALDVIVVGSGICGLTAAILLRKAGHRVRVFERLPTSTAFGAGIVLGHNAIAVLEACGCDYTRSKMSHGNGLKVYQSNAEEFKLLESVSMNVPEYAVVPGLELRLNFFTTPL